MGYYDQFSKNKFIINYIFNSGLSTTNGFSWSGVIDEGDEYPLHLKESLKDVKFHIFIARIDQTQEPVLNPAEHTDWKWRGFETTYEILKWVVEKKMLRYVFNYLTKNPCS